MGKPPRIVQCSELVTVGSHREQLGSYWNLEREGGILGGSGPFDESPETLNILTSLSRLLLRHLWLLACHCRNRGAYKPPHISVATTCKHLFFSLPGWLGGSASDFGLVGLRSALGASYFGTTSQEVKSNRQVLCSGQVCKHAIGQRCHMTKPKLNRVEIFILHIL